MSHPQDIIVKLRLLVKPPININNFFYKVTYTTFGYQNKDGSHVSPKVINDVFVKFTANPSANKNGMLAIDSQEIVLLEHSNSIKKISFPDAKNGSAWFQIENRSKDKVAKKSKYPIWSHRNERKVSEYKWDTTSSINSTTPKTQKTQKINQKCPHTVDGAIEIAKYIVDEIKRNVKSLEAQKMRYHLTGELSNELGAIFDKTDASIVEISKKAGERPIPGASHRERTKVFAYGLWVKQVDTGKPWDHKPIIANNPFLKKLTVTRPIRANDPSAPISKSHFHKYKDYDYYYDVWSNIHYGYVGLSVGFDENILITGSNFQQFLQNTKNRTLGVDTPDDITTMKMGFILFKKFGTYAKNLSFQDVLNILDTIPRKDFPASKNTHWCYNLANPDKVSK